MVKISIVKRQGEKSIKLESPYHPDLPGEAKALGGKFSSVSKAWYFDVRDEQRVRDLAKTIYGTDGSSTDADLVTLRVTFTQEVSEYRKGVFIAGRCVARAYGRDSGATLGEKVVLLKGKVDSGGSRAHWCTTVWAGTVVEIRDVPRAIVEAEVGDASGYVVEILDNNTPEPPVEALKAEKEALLKRLTQIEALLEQRGSEQ